MKIERMGIAHVSEVAELEKLCFSDPWSEKSVTSELDNELALWLVAVEDSRVAGYVGSQTVAGETDMMNIAVSEDHRRQGIANALITRLIEELNHSGAYSLSLEVRASNISAIFSLFLLAAFLRDFLLFASSISCLLLR